MRADGSWFHLTSPPPEAGNLALVQDHFFFCLGCCGQVVPSATQTPPQKKRKLQRQAGQQLKICLVAAMKAWCSGLGVLKGVLFEIV